MARTARAAQKITGDGLEPSYTAVDAANGEKMIAPNPSAYLEVINGGGAGITVSFVFARQVDGVTPDPKDVAVDAGERRKIRLGKAEDYEQEDGYRYVNYSSGTSVTAGLFYE